MNELVRHDRAFEGGDDVAQGQLTRITRQLVSAVRAAHTADDPGAAQSTQQLVEVGLGDLLAGGDFGALNRPLSIAAGKLDHGMSAVVTAHRQSHENGGKLSNPVN